MATYTIGSLPEYRTRKELYTPEYCRHTILKCCAQSRPSSWRCHDCGTWFYFRYKTDDAPEDPKKDRVEQEKRHSDARPSEQSGDVLVID